jgi:UDP-3-O-acyl N-acetylglucosamine deacetylase
VIPRRAPAKACELSGVGLFSGRPVTVVVRPGEDGIRIVRTDSPGKPSARATVDALARVETALGMRNTTIEVAPGVVVATVEHVLSALAGLGVSDAEIEVDGAEMPAGDGSSAFIVEAIQGVGVRDLEGDATPIVVRETIRVGEGDVYVEASPSDAPAYEYRLEYPGQAYRIPDQRASWNGNARAYAAEIAPARTFCLEEEALAMRAAGMCGHLTARDMLVFGAGGPIDNELRFENEPARHKLLDLIGDLSLAGAPIIGRVVAHRSGHALNHELARRLAALRRA